MPKVTALLTGRSNNSLKDKNILPVLGRPLLAYPALAARNCPLINNFYASSDDTKILDAAARYDFIPILRPPELALPNAQHVDAITHALLTLEKAGVSTDILVVLLANSAIIKSEWLTRAIQYLIDDPSLSAVVPVELNQDHHPYRAKRLDENGNLKSFFDFKEQTVSSNRQDLCESFFLCHNFWVLNLRNGFPISNGEPPWPFMGGKVRPMVVENCFDVHSMDDISRCEKWLLDEKINYEE